MSFKKNYKKILDIRKNEWENFFTKYKNCDEDEEFDFSFFCKSPKTEEKLNNNSFFENTLTQLGNLTNISNNSDDPSFISEFKKLEIEQMPKVVCVKRGIKTKIQKKKRTLISSLHSNKIINNNTNYEITEICFKDKFLSGKATTSNNDIIETFDSHNKIYTVEMLADNPENLFDDNINFNFNKKLTKCLHNKQKCLKRSKENSKNIINIKKPSKIKKIEKFENSVIDNSYVKRKKDLQVLNLKINNFEDNDVLNFTKDI